LARAGSARSTCGAAPRFPALGAGAAGGEHERAHPGSHGAQSPKRVLEGPVPLVPAEPLSKQLPGQDSVLDSMRSHPAILYSMTPVGRARAGGGLDAHAHRRQRAQPRTRPQISPPRSTSRRSKRVIRPASQAWYMPTTSLAWPRSSPTSTPRRFRLRTTPDQVCVETGQRGGAVGDNGAAHCSGDPTRPPPLARLVRRRFTLALVLPSPPDPARHPRPPRRMRCLRPDAVALAAGPWPLLRPGSDAQCCVRQLVPRGSDRADGAARDGGAVYR
jgi:hypothetical protein